MQEEMRNFPKKGSDEGENPLIASFSAFLLPALPVFLPGGQAAPDVTLRLVLLQHRLHLPVEGGVDAGEALPQICWCQVRNKKFWDPAITGR